MPTSFNRILFLIATLLAGAGWSAASAAAMQDPAEKGAPSYYPAPMLDEFGLPLALQAGDTAADANWRPAQRWKQEVEQLARQESQESQSPAAFGVAQDSDRYARFDAAFAEAKVPDCLREDGLKRQPPRILFFGFQGVLAFPFVALAKIRGKCL